MAAMVTELITDTVKDTITDVIQVGYTFVKERNKEPLFLSRKCSLMFSNKVVLIRFCYPIFPNLLNQIDLWMAFPKVWLGMTFWPDKGTGHRAPR